MCLNDVRDVGALVVDLKHVQDGNPNIGHIAT